MPYTHEILDREEFAGLLLVTAPYNGKVFYILSHADMEHAYIWSMPAGMDAYEAAELIEKKTGIAYRKYLKAARKVKREMTAYWEAHEKLMESRGLR